MAYDGINIPPDIGHPVKGMPMIENAFAIVIKEKLNCLSDIYVKAVCEVGIYAGHVLADVQVPGLKDFVGEYGLATVLSAFEGTQMHLKSVKFSDTGDMAFMDFEYSENVKDGPSKEQPQAAPIVKLVEFIQTQMNLSCQYEVIANYYEIEIIYPEPMLDDQELYLSEQFVKFGFHVTYESTAKKVASGYQYGYKMVPIDATKEISVGAFKAMVILDLKGVFAQYGALHDVKIEEMGKKLIVSCVVSEPGGVPDIELIKQEAGVDLALNMIDCQVPVDLTKGDILYYEFMPVEEVEIPAIEQEIIHKCVDEIPYLKFMGFHPTNDKDAYCFELSFDGGGIPVATNIIDSGMAALTKLIAKHGGCINFQGADNSAGNLFATIVPLIKEVNWPAGKKLDKPWTAEEIVGVSMTMDGVESEIMFGEDPAAETASKMQPISDDIQEKVKKAVKEKMEAYLKGHPADEVPVEIKPDGSVIPSIIKNDEGLGFCAHCLAPMPQLLKNLVDMTPGLVYVGYHNPDATPGVYYVETKHKKVVALKILEDGLAHHGLEATHQVMPPKNKGELGGLMFTVQKKKVGQKYVVANMQIQDDKPVTQIFSLGNKAGKAQYIPGKMGSKVTLEMLSVNGPSEVGIMKLQAESKKSMEGSKKIFKASSQINIGDLVYLSGQGKVSSEKNPTQVKPIGIAMHSAMPGKEVLVAIGGDMVKGAVSMGKEALAAPVPVPAHMATVTVIHTDIMTEQQYDSKEDKIYSLAGVGKVLFSPASNTKGYCHIAFMTEKGGVNKTVIEYTGKFEKNCGVAVDREIAPSGAFIYKMYQTPQFGDRVFLTATHAVLGTMGVISDNQPQAQPQKYQLFQKPDGSLAFMVGDKEVLSLNELGQVVISGEMFQKKDSMMESMDAVASQFWEVIGSLNPLKAQLFKAAAKQQVLENGVAKLEAENMHLKAEFKKLHFEYVGKYEARAAMPHRQGRFENVADNIVNEEPIQE